MGLAFLWRMVPALGAAEPVVSKVRAAQMPGRMAVEVRYDVAWEGDESMWVEVEMATGAGENFVLLTQGLSGEVGMVAKPGTGKRLRWEPGLEWVGRVESGGRFRVKAAQTRVGPGLVWIPPGTFRMGSPKAEPERDSDEGPVTEVRLTRGYWLGKHEVTQGEWEAVMGSNPSRFQGSPDLPVENVTWEEAMEYGRKVTERERAAGRLPAGYEYRLPTEAEWEYACRSGTTTATAFGDRLDSTQANFDGNRPYHGAPPGPYLGQTAKVGSYKANAWGLHDMHGNVWEWCLDRYEDRLAGGGIHDPSGATSGSLRVCRGGGWFHAGGACRSACRFRDAPSTRSELLGMRIACAPVLMELGPARRPPNLPGVMPSTNPLPVIQMPSSGKPALLINDVRSLKYKSVGLLGTFSNAVVISVVRWNGGYQVTGVTDRSTVNKVQPEDPSKDELPVALLGTAEDSLRLDGSMIICVDTNSLARKDLNKLLLRLMDESFHRCFGDAMWKTGWSIKFRHPLMPEEIRFTGEYMFSKYANRLLFGEQTNSPIAVAYGKPLVDHEESPMDPRDGLSHATQVVGGVAGRLASEGDRFNGELKGELECLVMAAQAEMRRVVP